MTADSSPPIPSSVTFVMPNFNHAEFLRESLSALFDQTRPADRIIFIDDGSTDDRSGIIASLIKGRDDVTHIRNPKNRGVIACLNQGLDLVDTEFVAFSAADDRLDRRFVERSLPLLLRNAGAALSVAKIIVTDGEGKMIGERPTFPPASGDRYISPTEFARIIRARDNFLIGQVAMYRTAALKALGGFDGKLASLADGMAMRVLAARHGFCFVDEVLGVWRKHGGNYSVKTALDTRGFDEILENAKVVARAAPVDGFPPNFERLLERRIRFDAARVLLENRQFDIRETWAKDKAEYRTYLRYPALFRALSALAPPLAKFLSLAALYLIYRPYHPSAVLSFLTRRRRTAKQRAEAPRPPPRTAGPGSSSP